MREGGSEGGREGVSEGRREGWREGGSEGREGIMMSGTESLPCSTLRLSCVMIKNTNISLRACLPSTRGRSE